MQCRCKKIIFFILCIATVLLGCLWVTYSSFLYQVERLKEAQKHYEQARYITQQCANDYQERMKSNVVIQHEISEVSQEKKIKQREEQENTDKKKQAEHTVKKKNDWESLKKNALAYVQEKNKTYVCSKELSWDSSVGNATAVASESKKKYFSWPIDKTLFWLSSVFGKRKKSNGNKGFHHGIDMAALKGTPVKAAAAGKVIEARYASGFGNTILVQHDAPYKTRYAHLNSIGIFLGQQVKKGQQIGRVGDTGFVRKKGHDASHLHFEVLVRGKRVNPLHFLPK